MEIIDDAPDVDTVVISIGAELSGAASMVALLEHKFSTRAGEKICVLVCGAGADGVAS